MELQTPRHTITHNTPIWEGRGRFFFRVFDEHVWEMYPLRGTPSYQNFPRHIQWTCLGRIKCLMGPRNHEIFFPDMFIEHVWEITPTDITIRFFFTFCFVLFFINFISLFFLNLFLLLALLFIHLFIIFFSSHFFAFLFLLLFY